MKKLLMMIAMLLPLVAMAQGQKNPEATVPQGENTLRLAAELSKYGYTNHDALSLIQAARLSKQAGLTPIDQAKATEGENAEDNGTKNGQVSLDPSQLLADAAAMASEDGVMLALIDDVNSNVRGAVGGESYTVERVKAKGTDVYKVKFRANELAVVTVIGDGDTDLDLYVYDANGNLIDSDTDYTDNCVCTWEPRWTGTFTIKVVNRGNVYNRYVIATN